MGKVRTVALSVAWRPQRFPLRWAWTPDDVPAWDMSRGVSTTLNSLAPHVSSTLGRQMKAAHSAGLKRSDGSPFIWKGVEYTADYEDYLDLPPERQRIVVKKIEENGGRPWPTYMSQSNGRNPTAIHEGNNPLLNEVQFPRLVRAWPGESRRFKVVPAVNASEFPEPLKEWPPTKQVHKAVLSLKSYVKRHFEDKELGCLMGAVLGIAEKYSLLNPSTGDSLDDWLSFYTEVVYLDELRKEIFSRADVDDRRVWHAKINQHELETLVDKRTRERCWPCADGWKTQGYGSRYSVFGEMVSLKEIGEMVYRSCRVRGLKGSVQWAPWGVDLDVGAQQWALVEIAESFVPGSVKLCVICGKPYEGRQGSKTCSSTCRSNKKRQRDAALSAEMG